MFHNIDITILRPKLSLRNVVLAQEICKKWFFNSFSSNYDIIYKKNSLEIFGFLLIWQNQKHLGSIVLIPSWVTFWHLNFIGRFKNKHCFMVAFLCKIFPNYPFSFIKKWEKYWIINRNWMPPQCYTHQKISADNRGKQKYLTTKRSGGLVSIQGVHE